MNLIRVYTLAFLIATSFNLATPANIVVWNAIGTISTRLSMWPLIESLADKGHNVTYISAFASPESDTNSKIRSIVPKKLNEALGSWDDVVNFFKVRGSFFGIPRSWYDAREFGILGCEALHSDEEFISWATSPETKVDAVIMEMSVNECAYGFVHLWKSKLMIYSTTTAMTWFNDAYGLPDETSSISDYVFGYPSSIKNQMNFWQRFLNTMNPILYTITREWFYLPQVEEISRRGLGQALNDMPSLKEFEKNTSLIFLTTHYSFETARSLPPNFIPIGGTVVMKKMKQLPEEMRNFIDSAKNGFIYISFGTVTAFTHFELDVQINFINALKEFPDMRFIWKSGQKINATTIPANVLLTKWAPQQTILAHPKIKAFITHAGMGSTTEAIHYSVPLICIPIMMDQDLNANVIDERGAGIKLEVLTLKKHELQEAILRILNDRRYRDGMTKLTKIFKDRPMPPIDNALWWIEFVLRHENIHEVLTPPSAHQPWWKRRLLDVWTVAISIVILFVILALKITKAIISFVCSFSYKRTKSKNE